MKPRVKKPAKVDRCGPTKKRRYRTAAAAAMALQTVRKQALDPTNRDAHRRHERRVHSCVHCGGWHLTSQR